MNLIWTFSCILFFLAIVLWTFIIPPHPLNPLPAMPCSVQVSLVSKDSPMLDGLDNASTEMEHVKVRMRCLT